MGKKKRLKAHVQRHMERRLRGNKRPRIKIVNDPKKKVVEKKQVVEEKEEEIVEEESPGDSPSQTL